jgi:hypothetical protein
MHATQAEDIIFELLRCQKHHDQKAWARSGLTQYSKFLREAGLLPSGTPGHSAPHIDATHLTNLLIALLGCEKPKDAPYIVTTYAGLPTDDYGYEATLGEFMAHAVKDAVFAERIETLTLSRTFQRAYARLRDEKSDEVKTITFAANDAIKAGGAFYIDATVSGGFLAQIALEATNPRLKVGLDGRDLTAERARRGWGAAND